MSPVARDQLDRVLASVQVEHTDAEEAATKATKEKPLSTKVWLERALAHQTAGDVDAARAAFTTAAILVKDEPSWAARTAMGRASFELTFGNDLDAALENAEVAAREAKDDADAASLVVQVLRARGDDGKAEAARAAAAVRFADDERFTVPEPARP